MEQRGFFTRSLLDESARLMLGIVLTGASASKAGSFHAFAQSTARLTDLPYRLAVPAALLLVIVEGATGLILLSRKETRLAATAAFSLFLGFTAVLTSAIVRGIGLPCNCFGALGPELPIHIQAVFDISCAGLSLALIHSRPQEGTGRWGSAGFIRGAGFVAFLWASALIAWPHRDSPGTGLPVQGLVRTAEKSQDSSGRPSVLLLADFDDFSCQLCLDDFLAFCDSLNGERFRRDVSVRLLARRDSSRSAASQARILEGWAAGNRYLFPVSLDSERVFERSGVGKTSAIILAGDGRLVDIAHFPTGSGKRNEILRAIGD